MTNPNFDSRALMQEALLRIDELEAELEAIHRQQTEPIAIIGMGCHYPGGTDSPERYWQNLLAGFDAIIELPDNRVRDMFGTHGRRLFKESESPASFLEDDAPTSAYALRGGFLSRVDQFDPAFFGLSAQEVLVMDPAHRLLLETTWQALEDANLVPAELLNTAMGVFMGAGTSGYIQPHTEQGHDLDTATGNTPSAAAGRLSFLLGITGPCISIDTACSASLTAIHLACQSLRTGECTAALAGGVNMILEQDSTTMFANGNLLSTDARCKSFDAAANGFVRGEGCGVIVLKRLSDAEADQDNILAVIRGTAVNQNGSSAGLTIPNGLSQERVIRAALDNAGLDPAEISYIEAHGTGTPLGDSIEMGALSAVFQERTEPLYIGSAKTNMGHLELASGVAGVQKLALALQHREIPPHLHFQTPSHHIDWESFPMQIPTATTPWPALEESGERIGGTSAFGFNGTNAHVIVAEAPAIEPTGNEVERPTHLLTLSAKSEAALQAYAQRYRDFLTAHPEIPLGDLCYTSHVGRSHFTHRLTVVADSLDDVQTQLAAYADGDIADGLIVDGLTVGSIDPRQATPKVGFLFTGQGTEYVRMGRELYATQPTFRAILDHCDELFEAYLGESLIATLYPESGLPTQRAADHAQPACFALDYTLATLWQSWGIQPHALAGQGVGELAAACVAGVFTVEDGLKLAAARGRFLDAQTQDGSVMEAFRKVATAISYHKPEFPFISTRTGGLAGAEVAAPAYWIRQAQDAVHVADGMRTLEEQGIQIILEIGSHASLRGTVGQILDKKTRRQEDKETRSNGVNSLSVSPPLPFSPSPPLRLPGLREGQTEWQQMLTTLGVLYVRGVAIDWQGVEQDYQRRKVNLPTYPFQRERYWAETVREDVSPVIPAPQPPASPRPEVQTQSPPEIEVAYHAPQTPVEAWLAGIWQDHLGLESIGRDDHFFRHMGGNSLRTIELTNRIQAELGAIVHVQAIFDAPTVGLMASYLQQHYADSLAKLGLGSHENGYQNGHESALSSAQSTLTHDMLTQIRHGLSSTWPTFVPSQTKLKPAVFILSPPRSGSTLLRVMLAGHPQLFAPPELDLLTANTLREVAESLDASHRMDRMYHQWQGLMRALMEIDEIDMEAAKAQISEMATLPIEEVYAYLQAGINERLLVDKSPSYTFDPAILRRAEATFENARYIHLVRHPYGMIRSFEEARMDLLNILPTEALTEQPSRRMLAEAIWLSCNEHIQTFLQDVPSHRQLQLRFEDLVTEPQSALETLCGFLDIELDATMLDPYQDSRRRMTDGVYKEGQTQEGRMIGDPKFHQHKGINPAVATQWRDAYAEDFLSDMTWLHAERFGYTERIKSPASNDSPASAKPISFVSLQPGNRNGGSHNGASHNESGGNRTPLFLIYPADGVAFPFVSLLPYLSPAQPVYALQARGIYDELPPHKFESVEALATATIGEMKTIQPHGPYAIGGWSFGGLVAFEIARRLTQQGQAVSFLGIMDIYPRLLIHEQPLTPWETLKSAFSLIGESAGGDYHKVSDDELFRSALEQEDPVAWVIDQMSQRGYQLPFDTSIVRRISTVLRNNVEITRSYQPQPYAGDITLFRAKENERAPKDGLEQWQALTPHPVDAIWVDGNHDTMMRADCVETLGQALAERLGRQC